MKYLPKDVHKLKDTDLLKELFPKEVLTQLKQEAQKSSKPTPIRKPTKKS